MLGSITVNYKTAMFGDLDNRMIILFVLIIEWLVTLIIGLQQRFKTFQCNCTVLIESHHPGKREIKSFI